MFHDETMVANNDLDGYQYHIMVNSVGPICDRNYVAGGISAGILQNKPKSGEHAAVRMFGKSRIKAGGTIVGGEEFTATVSATATAIASGDFGIGLAITGVASGGIFEGLIHLGGWKGQ